MSLLSRIFKRTQPPSVHELAIFLLDREAELGSRDDVAMDLARFDDAEAEAVLLEIVLDSTQEEMLIDSAGDSLREIWERKGKFLPDLVARMHPSAQKFFRPK
jgi:hypothetical protein